MKFKILGQEPAALVGVIEAFLVLLLSFGVAGLDQERVGVLVAATSALLGLVVAYTTKATLLAALVGFVKAAFIVAVTFGAPLTDNETASAIAFITITAGFFLRERTYAVETPISASSPGEKREQLEILALAA